MTKTDFYKRYFEQNTKFFWPDVKRLPHPAKMAETLRIKIMSMAGVVKAVMGKEELGHWAWQFAILSDELERTSTKEKAHREIERFRDCAKNGVDYQRLPERQSGVFGKAAWR